MASFAVAIGQGSWASAIKLLDAAAKAAQGDALVPLLLNRALCNLKLQLFRKALKVHGQAALMTSPADAVAAALPRAAAALHRLDGCRSGTPLASPPMRP